jgi:DNA-binding transcriptional LysR family regulator
MKPFEKGQTELLRSALDDPVILSGGFWTELRVFLAVAKLGSFGKAGVYLGISTPSVSRNVKRLQDQLRAQLVVLSSTGASLTKEGRSIALALSELDHRVFVIANSIKQNGHNIEGTVRISATEGLAGVFVASKLAAFHGRYPGIAVHLKTPINISSLRENRADMMIGFEPFEAADIKTVKLGTLHFIPIASELYVQQRGVPNVGATNGHIFVDSHFYAAQTGLWGDWKKLTATGQVAADCDSSLSYAMAVIGGLGIGLLGSYVLSDASLRPLDLGVHVKVPLYLYGLKERLEAKPVRVVMDWLTEIFGATNPWFADELTLRTTQPTSFLKVMHALRGEPQDAVH